jgi:ubiquinone/menaquinone biosynthesis C-methylase UbiE
MPQLPPSSPVGAATRGNQRLTPDYGLDAPDVVRNLAIVATLGLGAWAAVQAGLWSGRIPLSRGSSAVVLDTGSMFLPVGVLCAVMALYMVWTSKYGKLREREHLLDLVRWSGTERVLDVGCGRGLMAVGAARRAVSGLAVGIDIWQAEDLSGNRPAATRENARREGVTDRVQIATADMRRLPFGAASFDVVVSSAAIHNLYDRGARAAALREIVRVLAPGGSAVLDDIRHLAEYERELRSAGVTDVRWSGSAVLALVLAAVTMGRLHPRTLVARKPD